MKRLQALLLLSLASTFLLFGCGKKEEVDEQPAVSQVIEKQPELEETNETAEPAAEEAPTDDEAPPKEGMVRSTLTNEWIEGDLKDARPISIMVPNDSSALPHYNLSKADILYECPVEGNITRSMAVIKDWENLDRIGNVRSCRDYFVYWAFEWDSIYLHFGGPYYINEIIERKDTDHITGCAYGDKRTDGLYEGTFYRSTDKKAPQNAYASAEGINKGSGVRFISEYLNVPYEHTLAAGDAENDISMLKAVKLPCVMKNARPEMYAYGAYLTEQDNNHSGIAEIIEKFML